MLLVLFLAAVIPLSLICWLASLFLHLYKPDAVPVAPPRLMAAALAPIVISVWGLRKRSLDMSGAIAGLVVGFVLTLSNLCFFSSLLMFFVAGSKVTKFRGKDKKKLEEDFKEGGQRNWVQVLCNGGIATEMGLLYLIEVGCTERVVDFTRYYNASWLSAAVLGALCCSAGDTFASEIGTVVGRNVQPRLITNLQIVPRGTNGGISLVGTLSSLIGGLLVGVAYYLTLLVVCNEYYLETSPPQWLLIPVSGLYGVLGSAIDSLIGATLQYSGYDRNKKRIVEHPGPGIDYISGREMLDNHSVNLLASLCTALLAPRIAYYVWGQFT